MKTFTIVCAFIASLAMVVREEAETYISAPVVSDPAPAVSAPAPAPS